MNEFHQDRILSTIHRRCLHNQSCLVESNLLTSSSFFAFPLVILPALDRLVHDRDNIEKEIKELLLSRFKGTYTIRERNARASCDWKHVIGIRVCCIRLSERELHDQFIRISIFSPLSLC